MADGNYITHAEVQQMIEQALSSKKGSGAGEKEAPLKHQPLSNMPTARGESAIEIHGIAMGKKVAMQEAINAAKEKERESTPPMPPTIAEKRKYMGMETPMGVAAPSSEVTTSRSRMGSVQGGLDRAVQKEKPKAELLKQETPSTIPSSVVNEAIAQILNAMKYSGAATQAWVTAAINAAVPEPIRVMGAAATIYYGDFLRLEPSTVAKRSAVWGMMDPTEDGAGGAGGGLDLSKAALGYKIDPDGDNADLVRTYAGEIDRIAVAQTDLHPMIDGYYAYVRRTISNNTMLVTTAASVPANDATYVYYRLYQFAVASGTASLKLAYRPFDIDGGRGFTGTVTVISAMQYASPSLQYKTKLLTYSNGSLMSVGTESAWVTLFAAVTGCPA